MWGDDFSPETFDTLQKIVESLTAEIKGNPSRTDKYEVKVSSISAYLKDVGEEAKDTGIVWP